VSKAIGCLTITRRARSVFHLALILCAAFGTAATSARIAWAAPSTDNAASGPQVGIASWYGAIEAGHRTASGTIFDPRQATAAHRTLPLGTCVRVTSLGTGRVVTVPITDRGPYARGRLIDLSESAAQTLGMKWAGLALVRVDIVESCIELQKTWPIARS
jgi:rare lipoprotein A